MLVPQAGQSIIGNILEIPCTSFAVLGLNNEITKNKKATPTSVSPTYSLGIPMKNISIVSGNSAKQERNTPIFFLPLVILNDKARIVTKPSNVNTNNGNAESVGLSVGSYFMSKISSCCNPIALNLKDSPFGVLNVLVSKLSLEGDSKFQKRSFLMIFL